MLKEQLSVEAESIEVCDIGAAFLVESPPYAPLIEAELAHLTTFEPDVRQLESLRKLLGPKAAIVPKALADGMRHTLHICGSNTGMTSLLEPDPASLGFFNAFSEIAQVLRTEEIDTFRLDDVDEVPPIDFLKMDVQGSELIILQNGWKKLSDATAVQVEVSFIPLYKTQPTIGDIDCEMRRNGFIPHRIMEVKRWSIAPTIRDGQFNMPLHQLLEADIVYIKDLVHPNSFSECQLKKLALLSHYVFDSPDLVIRCLLELQKREIAPSGVITDYLAWISG